jgi:hypothetical protein
VWSRTLPWAVVGTLAAGLAAVLALWPPWRAAAPPPRVTRMSIAPFGPAAPTIDRNFGDVALSPDGTHIVYIGNNGTQLFVRALDALEPVAIATSPLPAVALSVSPEVSGSASDGVVALRRS